VVTLLIAMTLVILVVYLFLQNWRATLIPMIAVPVSLIGTFAFFPALGFSINTLSLFGLVLAIGLVVDDAIVVVEAVEHHIEEGMAPREATLQAMREVSGPVVAIALILASVFIPMAFMSGIQGRLNKQFAVTVAISVLISAFNALTLSPALSAMLLRPRKLSTRDSGPIFPRLQLGVRQAAGPLRGDKPGADPQGSRGHGGPCLLHDPGWFHRKETAYQLSAGRGLRLSFSERATSAGRVAGSHHSGCGQGSERPIQHAGRGAFHDDCGVQLSIACLDHEQFLVFCGVEAVVRAAVSQP
jgi:multidrug efflux pump subunit AcrB